MITLIIVLHVIVCFLLITLVLIQRGRGSGLVESFAGVESMFGTKTNAFLTRSTTVLSIIFFLTCLGLAILSVRQSRSLLSNVKKVSATAEQGTAKSQAVTPAAPATAAAVSPTTKTTSAQVTVKPQENQNSKADQK
ncbi:MAG: preprotein translocase subunit SecG [Candidatus Omnitrophica bacterium]|nr:preprotein translocase subunit SecG [Candidatus Omnitrophota bacterium]